VSYVSQRFPLQNADSFIAVSVYTGLSSFLLNFSPDHGFCNGCMDEWLESNRVGPLRRLRQLHCPTCRKPARESDLGRMFVETVVLDEDSEYQTRLANTITEQTNSTRESIQTITSISSSVQVTRAASGVVNSRDALSRSQYAETEPIVKTVMEVSTTPFTADAGFSPTGRNCQ